MPALTAMIRNALPSGLGMGHTHSLATFLMMQKVMLMQRVGIVIAPRRHRGSIACLATPVQAGSTAQQETNDHVCNNIQSSGLER